MILQHTVTEPNTLLPFLFASWPEVKKIKVRQWLKFGSVHVNGRSTTRFNHELVAGDVVAVKPHKPADKTTPLPKGLRILHEDADIIVLEKGAGWLTIAKDSGKGRNVYSVMMDHIRSVNPKLKAWIVHRLDRDTSGLLVFAKTEESKTIDNLRQQYTPNEHSSVEGVAGKVKVSLLLRTVLATNMEWIHVTFIKNNNLDPNLASDRLLLLALVWIVVLL